MKLKIDVINALFWRNECHFPSFFSVVFQKHYEINEQIRTETIDEIDLFCLEKKLDNLLLFEYVFIKQKVYSFAYLHVAVLILFQ